jgi:cellobiose phosphorylase
MRILIAVVGLSVASLAAASAAPANGGIVGYISDTKCATSGAKAKTAAEWIQPAAFEDCVKKCVKEGSAAVFVTEDNRILKVDAASSAKIEQYLGHKVSVTGKVEGTTLKIDAITALKLK